MWRSILAWGLFCASFGTAILAMVFGLRTIALGVTEAQSFWLFAADVGITTAFTILSVGLGIACDHANKASV